MSHCKRSIRLMLAHALESGCFDMVRLNFVVLL